jgi:hypothetical protein
MTKLFRLRVKDGFVSPATGVTNCHGTDMSQMLIPGPVGVAIMKGKLDWRDVLRCVASGKDPSVLLTKPEAVKPREELAAASDFDQKTVAAEALAVAAPPAPVVSELELARAEGRAPDLSKLTPDELNEQAKLVGVDPAGYSTLTGLIKAVRKKMEA